MKCKCGCGKELVTKKYHKYYGIPKYISGHNHQNKKLSVDHCNSIRKGRMGMTFSLEHKKNLSVSHIGILAGENHHQWKGGTSRGYKTGYYSTEYKNWRKAVFERDDFICQKCFGKRGQYVTAHHIKSFAHYPKLRFDVNNGMTLCEECHKLTDNYKGKNKIRIAC